MKNSFNVEVNFSDSPKMPYEWNKTSTLLNIKLERISTRTLKNIMLFEGMIVGYSGVVLFSDTKNAVAIKLKNDGTILKRSFLDFEKCLDACEYACNLREKSIEFIASDKKVVYSKDLSIEKEMRDFILNSIKQSDDEDLSKYLYYLYFEEIENYSKEKLIKVIKNSTIDKNLKLYNFLIGS